MIIVWDELANVDKAMFLLIPAIYGKTSSDGLRLLLYQHYYEASNVACPMINYPQEEVYC